MASINDPALIDALASDPLDGSGQIILNPSVSAPQLSGSLVATRGLRMLEYARENDGISLTKGGALNRNFLTWAVEEFAWRGYEAAEVYAVNKVVDEQNYLPGWYFHKVLKRTKMIRKHRDKLVLSPRGRVALNQPGLLQAALFPETFRGRYIACLDTAFMGDFDIYFGLLLWLIRQAAGDWRSARTLFARVVDPNDSIHELARDYDDAPIHAFHLRILRLLSWFGLLEFDTPKLHRFDADAYMYRVTPLFDHFVYFNFTSSRPPSSLH